MEANDKSMYNELNKLKKCQLLDLIVNKIIPAQITSSDLVNALKLKIPDLSHGGKENGVNEIIDRPNYESDIDQPGSEFDVMKRLVFHLEARIRDQEMIIELLKKNNNDSFKTTDQKRQVMPSGSKLRNKNQHNMDEVSNDKVDAPNLNTKATNTEQGADKSKSKWEIVNHKKEKRKERSIILIGDGSEVNKNLKAVPRVKFIHVSKLHPNTEVKDVIEFLIPLFPEVQCEKLISKFPQYYSSFKVTINEVNFEKAMEPSVWPTGTTIRQFFRGKSKENADEKK